MNIRLFFLLAIVTPGLFAQQLPQVAADNGHIVDGNKYQNDALGMHIVLPGTWQESLSQSPTGARQEAPSDCKGPLCGEPDITASLVSTTDPAEMLKLAAYRVSGPYLNRQRYPLEEFATAMLAGSLGNSGWVPVRDMESISLGGKPAYRLSVRKRTSLGVAFGYVAESNGYVFMLVVTALSDPHSMQSAVEGIRFKP